MYFTCHPDDFNLYFDTICEEIFATQNCAIYYKKDPDSEWSDEEIELELSRMQLFVIPITSRFLYQDNSARTAEFVFAMDHHIPVLPLMQESGMDSEFNRICGDLQFLDKTASDNDPTALPYKEKLEKFLSSVLLGDELASQVRDAFDAYIFLSYRKKDRKYAQELMRLIHKNDFCRDIAIWYDEFLVPGENFNQAIKDAMEKSNLFTFVVTPNLLEPGNYVMTTEYPVAKEGNKPILPAEMEGTDRELLRENFKDIPDPTDAYDGNALTDALLERVRSMDTKENNSDPAHLFFIGLAYLGGIDVEVDNERAVSLITTAAEADLPEAMHKLSEMYENGEGVERNYEASVRWLEKLADYWGKKFNESGSEEDGCAYFEALCDLGDAWYNMGQLNQSKDAYKNMLSSAEYLAGHFGLKEYLQSLSVGYEKMGNINRAEGNLNDAKKCYCKCIELREKLSRETDMAIVLHDLSVSYENLGDIFWSERNLGEAKKWYLKGLKLFEDFYRKTMTVDACRDLSVSYDRMGNISQSEGSFREAKEWYLKSLKLREELCSEAMTVDVRQCLSVSYNKLGFLCWAEGDFDMAKMWYELSLKVREELNHEIGTVEARRNLAINYDNLGDVNRDEGNFVKAKECYLKSRDLWEELSHEICTLAVALDLSINCERLGKTSRAAGNLGEAKEWYCKGLDVCEKWFETGIVGILQNQALLFEGLGDISLEERNLAEAKDCYQKSWKLFRKLLRETGTVEAFDDFAVSCCKIGRLDEDNYDIEMLKMAESIWCQLVKACPQVIQYAEKLQEVRNILKE